MWLKEELSELIGLVYEGSFEPIPWTSVLGTLRAKLHANLVALVLKPASRSEPATIVHAIEDGVYFSSSEFRTYSVYMLDPFAYLPPERIYTPEEVVGVDRYFGSEFYNQYLKRRNIHFMMGADFRSRAGADCRFRVCRPHEGVPYSTDERELCQLLVPHFKRAVYAYSREYRMRSEKDLFAGTIDRMEFGVVILDESGKVLTVNRLADEILGRGEGLIVANHRLHSIANSDQLSLHVKQALTCQPQGVPLVSTVFSIPRRGRLPLSLLIKPISAPLEVGGRGQPRVAVFLRDPSRVPVPSHAVLRTLFGLTLSEAALASLLAGGMSLNQAAAQLSITRNTVKSRLRAIFTKMHVNRQSELVRMLSIETVANISES